MNIPNPPNDILLDSERKALFGRSTEYIGDIFQHMINKATPKWTGTEIAKKYGFQNSNITMIQNYKKYKREISSTELSNLLMEGLVTIKKLTDSCAKTEKERHFIEEKFKIIKLNKIAEQHNINAADVLEAYLKKHGINIEE